MRCCIIAGIAFMALAGCTTTQSTYTPLLTGLEAKPDDHPIDVFKDGAPKRQFEEIAEVNVHKEATHLITYDYDDALQDLKIQARAAGGDAIINIEETKSRYLETSMYHVTGTVVRYID